MFVISGFAGQTLTKTLDISQNDVGDELVIVDVTPLPVGAALAGKVAIAADKKSLTYTLDDYSGVAFSEAFRYRVQDPTLAPGTVGAVTGARVDIQVGE
jgi:hypothetical protein